MKKVMFVGIIMLLVAVMNAELINVNPDQSGDPWYVGGVKWDEKEMEWYNSLPVFIPSPDSDPATLPDMIDNSEKPYFRTIFLQHGGSCALASTIGYTFTFEINRKLNRHVLDSNGDDIEANEFPTHFTYNYWNHGDGRNGAYISNAATTTREFGVPDCSVWRQVTGHPYAGNVIQWMSGYDRYVNAMNNRVITSESIPVNGSEDNLTRLTVMAKSSGVERVKCTSNPLMFCQC